MEVSKWSQVVDVSSFGSAELFAERYGAVDQHGTTAATYKHRDGWATDKDKHGSQLYLSSEETAAPQLRCLAVMVFTYNTWLCSPIALFNHQTQLLNPVKFV